MRSQHLPFFYLIARVPIFLLPIFLLPMFLLPALAAADQAPQVTVLIGSKQANPGDAQPGPLEYPFGIDFDSSGDMIIGQFVNNRVYRFSRQGQLKLIAGTGAQGYSGDGGAAVDATFKDIHNVAVAPDDSIYVSDHNNHAVRKIDAQTGMVTTFAGNGRQGFEGDGGSASEAVFNMVMCVTLSPDKHRLIIADLGNRRIREIDFRTNLIRTVAGNGQKGVPVDGQLATDAALVDPRAAAIDATGNLYIVERGGHALRVVRPSGKIETVAGSGKKGTRDGDALQAEMNGPKHLAIDPDGNVYIADDMNHTIRKYDPEKKTLTTVLGDGEFKLNRPHGVFVKDGHLYVADSWNHRVLKMPIP